MKGMRRREEKEIGEPNKRSGWEKMDDAGVMRRRGMTSAEKRSNKKKKALIYRKDVLTTPRVGFNEFESLCICQQGSFVFLCLFVFVICVFFCVCGWV